MKEFEDLIDELASAYGTQSNIFICGNCGSASTASHFACDINAPDEERALACLLNPIDGPSGRTATHLFKARAPHPGRWVADRRPIKGVSFGKEKRFRVICLNDSIATIMAYSNDISYPMIVFLWSS